MVIGGSKMQDGQNADLTPAAAMSTRPLLALSKIFNLARGCEAESFGIELASKSAARCLAKLVGPTAVALAFRNSPPCAR